ncbi:MAG: hypothetical protein ACLQVI_18165 [Polyangiaceae bacterium]
MTAEKAHRRGLTRVAIVMGVCIALLGGALLGRDTLAEETAQARAFVADGQRALSRNERPAAVISFERARWLAPRAQFVRSALANVGVKDVEPPLARAFRFVTAREWSGIATVFGWASALGIAFSVVQWQRRRALWAALAAGCASVIGMAGVVESNASSPAIVTSADAPLLVAPYKDAAPERALPAGTMVLAGSHYEAFVHIRDADGQAGWVPSGSIEPIAGS